MSNRSTGVAMLPLLAEVNRRLESKPDALLFDVLDDTHLLATGGVSNIQHDITSTWADRFGLCKKKALLALRLQRFFGSATTRNARRARHHTDIATVSATSLKSAIRSKFMYW
jgi:hypothetical protein